MIQIIGYRHIYDKKTDTYKTVTSFFSKKWRAESVPDLLENIHIYLGKIPQEERWNLHYTVAKCKEAKCRVLEEQTTIPFDIDGIDVERIAEYHPVVLEVLGTKYEDTGIICSGNGLHYLIETDIGITDSNYFKATRAQYGLMCEQINTALVRANLVGKADSNVWATSHTLRLPNTENRKTKECGYLNKNSITRCYVIQANMPIHKDYAVHLQKHASLPPRDEFVELRDYASYASNDTPAILAGCKFLHHCKTNAATLSEPEWYAMLSITSRLDDGFNISHALSSPHPSYSERECSIKIEHAKTSSGPRKCTSIDTLWGGCSSCPNYGKVITPLRIKSDDFIETKATGFYNLVNKNGEIIAGKPNYNDLLKYFEQKHSFICDDNANVFLWNGRHWESCKDSYIHAFAEEHFDPSPSNTMCNEFLSKVHRTNVRSEDFFGKNIEKKINLQNGVLDFSTGVPHLIPSCKDLGFMYCAEYEYDPHATAHRFKKFMEEITCGRKELEYFIMEYIAYALMDVDCKEQVAMILLGDGANGKSTLIEVIKGLVGRKAYSILNLEQIQNEQQAAQLQGKLFNLSEETPKDSMAESSHFKNLVSGGEISVKTVYKPPYLIRNRAKIIVAANSMPNSKDNSHGFWRRFKIVPFDAIFTKKSQDKNLKSILLKELSGIINLVVEAHKRYTGQGGFTESVDIEAANKAYRNENTLSDFFTDLLDITYKDDDRLTINAVYSEYLKYCERNHVKYPVNKNNFGKDLKTYLLSQGHPAERTKTKVANNPIREYCYRRLKFATNNMF